MTALPIIETQAGDIAAYIPTNVISITDGQIFLVTDMFYQGQRPAIDVGTSVSRVGGAAQTNAVHKVSGSLRLDLAAYRELRAFSQFGSDLDAATQQQLTRGERMTELLKQGRYQPMSFMQETVAIYAGNKGYLDKIPAKDVVRFRNELFDFMNGPYADLMEDIHKEQKLTDSIIPRLDEALEKFSKQFAPSSDKE